MRNNCTCIYVKLIERGIVILGTQNLKTTLVTPESGGLNKKKSAKSNTSLPSIIAIVILIAIKVIEENNRLKKTIQFQSPLVFLWTRSAFSPDLFRPRHSSHIYGCWTFSLLGDEFGGNSAPGMSTSSSESIL